MACIILVRLTTLVECQVFVIAVINAQYSSINDFVYSEALLLRWTKDKEVLHDQVL